MKKILILTLIFIVGKAFSQCVNEVRTDFNSPTNNALPDNGNLPNNQNQYLNSFNWFPISNGYYSGYDPLGIIYAGINVGYLDNIMSDVNSPSFYNYIYDGALPTFRNGWELLLLNLGKFPNGDPHTIATGKQPGLPYIVIYNRYSGIVRVFVSFGVDGAGADAVDITLKFDSPDPTDVSGLLRLNEGSDKALDQLTDVKLIKSIAKDPNLNYKWMSCDFQIAYDPCTCYFPSELKIDVTKISTQNINLIGGSVSLPDQPLVNNANIVNPSNFLASFNYSEATAAEGVVMYKTINNMVADYQKKYEDYNRTLIANNEHNKRVKQNLALLKVASTIGTLIATGFTLDGLVLTVQNGEIPMEYVQDYAFLESISAESQEYQDMFKGLDGYQEYVFNMDFFKVAKEKYGEIMSASNKINIDKVFDLATKIFGEKMETFINQNFKVKETPSQPTMPTATFTEYRFSGTITDQQDTYGPRFYNPGTFKNQAIGAPTIVTSPYKYPIYNEILGTFALLETPELYISETINNSMENELKYAFPNPNFYGIRPIDIQRYQSWSKQYQISLKDDLKYKFNDALDIKSTKIQAAYKITAIPLAISENNPNVLYHCFQAPLYNENVVSTNSNLEINQAIITRGNTFQYNKTNPDFVPQDYGFFGGPVLPLVYEKDVIDIQTPYLPVDAFNPFVAGIGLANEAISFNEDLLYDGTDYNEGTDGTMQNINYNNVIKPFNSTTDLGYKFDFKIELKLIVDIEFNTLNEDGNPNSVTEIHTFTIPSSNIIYSNVNTVNYLETSPQNFSTYSENLTFLNTNFNGSQIPGCKLVGNQYTCQAWNDVSINGVLTTSNGYKVNILAGNKIEELPKSEVSPEIVLDIHQILDYSHPMPESNPIYVYNFCKGLNPNAPPYQANSPSAKILQQMATQDSPNRINQYLASSKKPFDFTLYPNPAKSSTRIVLENYDSRTTTFILTDVMGKNVEIKPNSISHNTVSLDVSTLEKGIYFVTVRSDFQEKTKQLIID